LLFYFFSVCFLCICVCMRYYDHRMLEWMMDLIKLSEC
jgi:hypothetical protein